MWLELTQEGLAELLLGGELSIAMGLLTTLEEELLLHGVRLQRVAVELDRWRLPQATSGSPTPS